MSIALRHRVERLEKFLQVRKYAADKRKRHIAYFARVYDLSESKGEVIWDRTVGGALFTPESLNAFMDELHRECNPLPDRETRLRRHAEMRD